MVTDINFAVLREMLMATGDVVGREVAEYTPFGSVIGLEETSGCGTRKWALVLATNDAADHLLQWADEQKRVRQAAADKAGHEVVQFPGNHELN